MKYVIYFYDRDTNEIYRKIFVRHSVTSKCICEIANSEIGDGWDMVSEFTYNNMIQSGDAIESDEILVYDLS